MTSTPKVGQKWQNKVTKDKVKVMKLLPGHVKVFDMDGSNQGTQFQVALHIFITKYRLVQDV